MARTNYLLEHLLDPRNRDHRSRLSVTGDTERLQFAYYVKRGDWNTVARDISTPTPWPIAWFPDANVAFLDSTTPVWDALRLAALGTPYGSTVISAVVEAEMSKWLNEPYRNKERAKAIKAAMDGATWSRRFRIEPSHPLIAAFYYYSHLLGFRRSLARQCPNGTTLVGTNAANKSDTMNAIRKRLGPRAQGLAKKGRDDAEAHAVINICDEMHCMMAILYALQNNRDTVLLTADADYIEIFYKAQWFLDTHYRAWLVARLIKAGQYGEPVKVMQDGWPYFDGPLTLYRRASEQMWEVLPYDSRSVQVALLYVAPEGMLYMLSFQFELKMLEMLETREATGRCTDLFGDANIHIDLRPLHCQRDSLYLGIGKDSTIQYRTNGIRSLLGRLDLEHSGNCCERIAR